MSRVIKPELWQFGGHLVVGLATSGDSTALAEPARVDGTRSANATGGPSTAEAEILADAQRQAEQILADAQARAEALIDQAVSGAEQVSEESRRLGYEEGRTAGLAAARSELDTEFADKRREIDAELEAARTERFTQLESMQGDIIELALSVASRILRQRVDEDPELVVAMVGEAIGRARNGEKLRVRANPRDIPLIEEHEDHLITSVQGLKELELVGDPGVSPGGCVIESGHGYIDARLDRQLELVGDALRVAVGYGR